MGRKLLCAAVLAAAAFAQGPKPLPGTGILTWEEDLSTRMMDGAHRFVERKIAESAGARQAHWRRDFSSRDAYEKSIEPNRRRFLEKTGVVDGRLPAALEKFGDDRNPALVSETAAYRVYQVRWPVLEGVHGEGLLLEPLRAPSAQVVVVQDADYTPEQMAGLAPGLAADGQFARRLAGSGVRVVVPTVIDRTARWSGRPEIRKMDYTHREWIYRQAFHMGRHIIGYEVQKVLAAVDWFAGSAPGVRMGVAGVGEGGLVALYAAAADTRISAALVSGYFNSRERVWAEPIYRNVWGLLEEFGDAEIASLVAPRGLVVEYARYPEVKNQKGDLTTPALESVEAEFKRIDAITRPGFQAKELVAGGHDALAPFLRMLGGRPGPAVDAGTDRRVAFSAGERQRRQLRELEGHVQGLIEKSESVREKFFLHQVEPQFADERWSTRVRHETRSPDRFIEASRWYRDYLWDEVLGRWRDPMLPFNPRTRRIFDTPRWTGYDVVLDVWPDVFAWGVLLVPKDIKPGERRPVVVCQHGRNGLPRDTVEPREGPYNGFAARLADAGYVTFSPHNLYRGEDRYRYLSRKANGVKGSLFSFIIGQHDQILRWLETLPFVDGKRMAFYGLSYGGETAVRVPPLLERYALSICSGDFNNWTRKVASTSERFSFMYTIEWEMPYFNMGNTFDYGEMAYLMFPRPFMVERGHHDRVGRDRWVAYEYAKVRWLYAQFNMPKRTAIEYFQGGHAINGQGTFEFLAKYLNWPGR